MKFVFGWFAATELRLGLVSDMNFVFGWSQI